jgi:Ca2+:H+ antiporter
VTARAAGRRRVPAWLPALLLVFVPVAAVLAARGAGPVPVFACSALAIVPLAGLMGEATEALADRFGAGIGGLLNATFGNAAELIIAIAALRHGLHDVVKASLTGSIVGNALLVLGVSIVAGGAGRDRQTFDRQAAGSAVTLLVLAAIGFLVPALFPLAARMAAAQAGVSPAHALAGQHDLSLAIAVVLFAGCVASLVFVLGTHRRHFAGEPAREPHPWPVWRATLALALATAATAWMSELLVDAVHGASAALGLTQVFVGVVIVAVVGNAAEHSTAVRMAIADRMDVSVQIAVGSSLQIALFVAPVLVFLSRALPGGPLDLRFTPFEVLAVAVAVGAVNVVAQDGESNWLEGVLLVAAYLVLALAFYYLP